MMYMLVLFIRLRQSTTRKIRTKHWLVQQFTSIIETKGPQQVLFKIIFSAMSQFLESILYLFIVQLIYSKNTQLILVF